MQTSSGTIVRHSVLDLAMVTQNSDPSETFARSAEIAQLAERLGYTRYWLAEHHNMEGVASTATAVLIGFIASRTKTLRVGSGGVMLPNHAPLVVAEQFGTLATLYPNRIDLGLGRAPGTDQLTARALRRDLNAVEDFESSIREVQQYLSADNRTASVRAIPGEGLEIPFYILGSSVDSAWLAARMGLPYAFASHFAPAQLLEAIAIYRRNFQPSAVLDKPYLMACVNVVAAETDEEAQFLATSFKKLFLGILTGKRQKMGPPVDPSEALDAFEEAAVQQMIRYSFIGSPQTVRSGLEIFVNGTDADELIFTSPVYDHAKRMRSFELAAGIMA